MTKLKLLQRIPGLRRYVLQRNEARLERNVACRDRDIARSERDEALRQSNQKIAQHSSPAGAPLFVPPGHFYSPIVDPEEAEQHLANLESKGATLSLPGIKIDRKEMISEWHSLLPFLTTIPFSAERTDSHRYAFVNDAYSWGDGSILHAMIRKYRPKRIIEVGSGWSSVCIIDTIESYLDNECETTFIEPYPQLLKDLMKTTSIRIKILENKVQSVPLSVFDELKAGDILFIDSTHLLRTGSDVCFELFEVLPKLAQGVIVHFHDIFWPFEYPKQWAVNDNRSWNELYAIRAYLMNNDDWRIIFFNDYFVKVERELIDRAYPNFLKNSGGALWLECRRNSAAS